MEKEAMIKEIISDTKSNNEDIVRSAIFKIGEKKINELKELLIEFLDNSNSFYRDAAAMSLGDLQANEVVPKIIELIQLPENEDNRGSLIYALQNFETKEFFLLFTDLIINGNFEVREMAIELIEKDIELIDNNIRNQALEKLLEAKKNCPVDDTENSVVNYINYVLEMLNH